jgi:hypothetical protein
MERTKAEPPMLHELSKKRATKKQERMERTSAEPLKLHELSKKTSYQKNKSGWNERARSR